MVTDATQATLEQPGLFWRRKYAFEGDSYHPPIEPASPQDLGEFRSASASATPPADSASDSHSDRWALDFMQKHRDPSSSVYYPAMVLAAFVQGWPKAFQIDKLDLDPWAEFMLWPGRNLPADADAWVEEPGEADTIATVCIDRMYVHDRQAYLDRIANLTRVDCTETADAIDNSGLFDLWQWVKDELLENEHRATAREISDKIGEIMAGVV